MFWGSRDPVLALRNAPGDVPTQGQLVSMAMLTPLSELERPSGITWCSHHGRISPAPGGSQDFSRAKWAMSPPLLRPHRLPRASRMVSKTLIHRQDPVFSASALLPNPTLSLPSFPAEPSPKCCPEPLPPGSPPMLRWGSAQSSIVLSVLGFGDTGAGSTFSLGHPQGWPVSNPDTGQQRGRSPTPGAGWRVLTLT